MTALITIRDLSMVFDGTEALKKISFEIGEGEIMGIIGRSGAGKTVLMHLLRGVDQPPTSGQVIYHVARCAECGQVELPSRAGQPCPGCGRPFTPEPMAFLREHVMDIEHVWGLCPACRRQQTVAG